MVLPFGKKLFVALCVVGSAFGLICGPSLLAQKVEGKAAAPDKAKEAKSYKRLPAYFGDIVDGSQKEKIYALQEKWGKQIDELAEQVKALQKQRDDEIEGVLTAEQKVKLEKTRADAKAKALEKAAAKKAAEEKEKAATAKPEAPKPAAATTTTTKSSK
jgi:hypothetical protein